MAVLVNWRPYADTSIQKKEVQNELGCMLVLGFLVLFSGQLIPDPYVREIIVGLALVISQVIMLLLNIAPLIFATVKSCYQKCKVKFTRDRVKKAYMIRL